MEKTLFLIEKLYFLTYIPVRYYDKTGEILIFNRGYEKEHDPVLKSEKLYKCITDKLMKINKPVLWMDDDFVYGASFDNSGRVLIYGPITTDVCSEKRLTKYKLDHKIECESFKIKRRTIQEICTLLTTISFVLTDKKISERDILLEYKDSVNLEKEIKKDYLDYTIENMDYEVTRRNFEEEISFNKNIKNGDLAKVEQFIDERIHSFAASSVGKLAEKNNKQNEYMGCTAIILASRAAIDGGLDSHTAYLMSDVYLQRLEKCCNATEVYSLILEMSVEFTKKVAECNENRSERTYVDQCKNFINRNLNKKFSVEEISTELNVSKSYLSRKFSEETGIGIQKYAQKSRVEAAANMLRYSDASILEVSNYFTFHSQSHFGKAFKEELGMTPLKYRNKYKLQDFKM